MTDIVERLRKPGDEVFSTREKSMLADEIERLRNALEQSIQMCAEHRDGRLAAREYVAVLESRLQEIGDLAASCRTGPALGEALAQIESMTDIRHNSFSASPDKPQSGEALAAIKGDSNEQD